MELDGTQVPLPASLSQPLGTRARAIVRLGGYEPQTVELEFAQATGRRVVGLKPMAPRQSVKSPDGEQRRKLNESHYEWNEIYVRPVDSK